MKLNIVMTKRSFVIDVDPEGTMWEVKQTIANILRISITPTLLREDNCITNTAPEHNLYLYHNGALMHSDCIVGEITFKPGASLRCIHVRRNPCSLRILIRCIGKTIKLRDEVSLLSTRVDDLRTILQNMIGLPVSTFRLEKEEDGKVLFDNHLLSYYGIKMGDTLVLQVWEEMEVFIAAVLRGDIPVALSALPLYSDNPKLNLYGLRVALFVAAHLDNVDLVTVVLRRGVR